MGDRGHKGGSRIFGVDDPEPGADPYAEPVEVRQRQGQVQEPSSLFDQARKKIDLIKGAREEWASGSSSEMTRATMQAVFTAEDVEAILDEVDRTKREVAEALEAWEKSPQGLHPDVQAVLSALPCQPHEYGWHDICTNCKRAVRALQRITDGKQSDETLMRGVLASIHGITPRLEDNDRLCVAVGRLETRLGDSDRARKQYLQSHGEEQPQT